MWKLKTLLPVLAALAIFILAQVYIVRQVWKQKDEVFALRYRSESREAIHEMATFDPYNGFKKAYFIIDDISHLYLPKRKALLNPEDSAIFAQNLRESCTKILSEDQVLSEYLSKYFNKLGLENKIKPLIYVNYIDLIDIQENIRVYKAPLRELNKQQSAKNILVYTFNSEGNNYKISFDYYIDIANKEKIILRELSLTLILSILSFGIICTIFIATMRNYLEEKRLSSLKTDFINNMTHELKTPLSTITVAGKTLKHDSVIGNREKIKETADMIGKQSLHLNELINLILEISMWERAQFQVDKKETRLEDLLKDIACNFRNGCGEDCIFTEHYDLKGASAEIDDLYFTTMINNLLNNAVKYSRKPAEIRLEAFSDDNGITVKIADKGIGISRSEQKNIFDKFYRVSTGNIHESKGLGLGLYYVSKIAGAHGGSVRVSSRKGKGSVFIVSIPKTT
ncbi:MAG: HAMP domain-containing sensor histidine kinase [Bacteroidales bacterium]|nr:HAMP domain-containing sensor histidine kinase [Bacteroidales bacterium]